MSSGGTATAGPAHGRTIILAMAAGVLAAGTLLAGCTGQPAPGASPSATSSPATSLSPGTSSSQGTSSPGTSSPGPAATGTVTASLPVVACPTTDAVAATVTPVSLPSARAVVVPAGAATDLAVYADTQGGMALVGPSGWKCAASYGADGGGGIVVYPSGEAVPQSWNAGWKLTPGSATTAITGSESSACYTCTLAKACPEFPAAAKAFASYLGHSCGSRPAREIVTAISSGLVSFEDPPGVYGKGQPSGGQYPANGVLTYYPGNPNGSWLETCTLPAGEKSTCTAVLNAFIAWYGQQ